MKPTFFVFAAAFECAIALSAQPHPGLAAHQPVHTLDAGHGWRAEGMLLPRQEKGRPFSATVRTQTVQIFLDGTRVSQTTTMLEYRDVDGRVRTETSLPGGSSANVVIRDPVAGSIYWLNPAAKSAVKDTTQLSSATDLTFRHGFIDHSGSFSSTDHNHRAGSLPEEGSARGRFHANETTEDLGTSTINGVVARGTRTTIVVPVGAIGNDREFRSIDEHWFSPELNLIVKSVSTDPRFGTTTYELTNISRQPPSPGLFQVPSDYVVATSEVRGQKLR